MESMCFRHVAEAAADGMILPDMSLNFGVLYRFAAPR